MRECEACGQRIHTVFSSFLSIFIGCFIGLGILFYFGVIKLG